MAQDRLDEAGQQIAANHLDDALQKIELVLDEQPANLRASFLRGVVLQRMGRSDEAIKVYEKLTRDNPGVPEPFNNLAVLYAQQGKHDQARDALLGALNSHPSYATAYENLGNIYAKMAINAYNKALELGDKHQPVPVNLSMLEKLDSQPKTASAVTVAAIPATTTPVTVTPRTETPVISAAAIDPAEKNRIVNTVAAWSSAWSAQDVEKYLGYYADSFAPTTGQSRQQWASERRIRLRKPGYIKVTIRKPEVELLSGNAARMTFVQAYESDRYRDAVKKTMLLEKIGDQWQITGEFSS